MASGMRNQERVPENLKKQLAFAVRTIQWSYGVFWSISERQPGVLEWGDGYYNGDIKTRKTVQSIEFNADQMAFQRSEQLKELYESLSAGEANPQARRPSASLSPEDLTDLEWYYLVCMSFVFNIGQGLPGRTLATGQSIWLRNAPYADSKVFSRSLLAKSASIQTVVCFPYLGGVVELGVTETVMEDPGLIQLAKNSLLQKSNPKDLSHDVFDGQLVTVLGCKDPEMDSLNNSSSDFEPNPLAEENGASLIQGMPFMDDELSNCVHNSMNSSDCISQTLVDPNKVVVSSNEDLHFHNVLSSLLKSSHQLILGPHFRDSNKESSFVNWKNNVGLARIRASTSQKVLKKVLMDVPRMHNSALVESLGDRKPKTDEIAVSKREILDERFLILKTLVPSINKVDKVSILDTTIEYLKQLEKRVEELEPSFVERTSDNYVHDKRTSKRKAIHIDNVDPELVPGNDLNVSVNAKDVLIELRCPSREGLLLEVMDVVSGLRLDSHSIQSSTSDGTLSLSIKSKAKEAATTSAAKIRRALHRFIVK